MMPVMDGWAFLEELQTLPATERPRVIVVSARSSLRDRAKAAELGADAFVAKPFSVDDLLVVLHDVEQASLSPARQTVRPASPSTPSSGSSSCVGTATVSTSPSGWSICRNTAPAASTITRARGRVPRREMELVVGVDLAAGDRAQIHRRRTAPPDVRDAIDEPPERLGLADAHRRVVPEPGGDDRIGERGPPRRPCANAVAFGPAVGHAHRGPAEGVDHHADARAVVDLDPDRHAEARVPAHVARRPVERVEHPPHAGRAGPVRALLAEDRVVGPSRRGSPRRSRARRPGRSR